MKRNELPFCRRIDPSLPIKISVNLTVLEKIGILNCPICYLFVNNKLICVLEKTKLIQFTYIEHSV